MGQNSSDESPTKRISISAKNQHRSEGVWMGIGKVGADEQDEWLDTKRKLFVWENRQSIVGHSSLGFQYLAHVDARQNEAVDAVSASRFLKVEIFHTGDGGEVFIKFTGVLNEQGKALELKDYVKYPQFVLNASVQEVKAVCEREFYRFGDYNLIGNNCQTFTAKVLKQLQARFKEDVSVEPSAISRLSITPEQEAAILANRQAWGDAMTTRSTARPTQKEGPTQHI